MNKKRVSLYFNLDNSSDKKMWDFLENYGKKSELFKRLLFNYMDGTNISSPKNNEELKKDNKKDNKLSQDDLNMLSGLIK